MSENTPVRTKDEPPVVVRPFRPFSSLIGVDVAARSDVGLVRPNNEDQFLVVKLTRSLDTILSTLPPDDVPGHAEEINYMMAVADGMGGHAGGEVASRLVLNAIVSLGLELPDWFFKVNEDGLPAIERRARQLVQNVGAVLVERGRQDPALAGMGSTLTAARSYGRDLLIVHVGDSRAYMFRAGRLHRLTKDHTYAQMLVDSGHLSPSAAATSSVRHVLVNALGGKTEHVDVDVDLLKLDDGDRLLLCSDGLSDLVDDETMAGVLASTPAAGEACSRLLQLALDRGGRDNVTVIVAAYTLPN